MPLPSPFPDSGPEADRFLDLRDCLGGRRHIKMEDAELHAVNSDHTRPRSATSGRSSSLGRSESRSKPGAGGRNSMSAPSQGRKRPLWDELTASRAIWPKMKASLHLVHWDKVKVKLVLLGEVKVKPIRMTRDSIKVRNPLVCLGKVPMFPGSLWTGREESLETGIRSLPRIHPAVPLQTRKIRRGRFQLLQGQGQTLEER